MQFHDQRAAGIPGLCPLFVGLRMRVTEKIIKTSTITILKHSTCYVVSWDLHPGDRVRRDDGERFLSYLPRMIIVRFENAKWQLEGLNPGEFPLYPVERTGVVSEGTGVKVVRKGFTLLPDFASTAFMMQGYTLDGAVADCGNILASGGLTEMMTTYVILSRVKKADGLHLTQAFAREIFRLGVAPGPHCSLKILRRRFSSGLSLDGAYGPEQAASEYHERMASLQMKLTRRKQRGALYVCFDCDRERTVDRFGADGKRENDVREKCVKPSQANGSNAKPAAACAMMQWRMAGGRTGQKGPSWSSRSNTARGVVETDIYDTSSTVPERASPAARMQKTRRNTVRSVNHVANQAKFTRRARTGRR
jgi:hypothetical protein